MRFQDFSFVRKTSTDSVSSWSNHLSYSPRNSLGKGHSTNFPEADLEPGHSNRTCDMMTSRCTAHTTHVAAHITRLRCPWIARFPGEVFSLDAELPPTAPVMDVLHAEASRSKTADKLVSLNQRRRRGDTPGAKLEGKNNIHRESIEEP